MKNKRLKTGFTIVETLVAVAILSISITATFTAVQGGIRTSTVAKDQTTAFYLAQEVVEYIKNIRDENALHALNDIATGAPSPRTWLYGIAEDGNDPCYFGTNKVCQIDSPSKTIEFCNSAPITSGPPNVCENLTQNEANGLYGHNSSWEETRFKREIQLEEVEPGKEIRVVVTISWTSNVGPRFFQISETLLNRE